MPVITSSDAADAVTEDADNAASGTTRAARRARPARSRSRRRPVGHRDELDHQHGGHANLANGYTLTQGEHDALVNAFTIDAATHSSSTGAGTIGWNYDIADSALDFLGANDR